MSISLCITNPCGTPKQSPQAASSMMDRDPPTGDSGEKMKNSHKTYRKAVMPPLQSTTGSTMFGSNKSKKCYNSSNRKKQQIIDKLKMWNVNIAPSGLDKSEDELSTVSAVTNQSKESFEPTGSGSLNLEQDNTSISVEELIKASSKKKAQKANNKCNPEEMVAHSLSKLTIAKLDRDTASNPKEHSEKKPARSFEHAPEGMIVRDDVHIHASSAHLTNTLTSSTTEQSSGCSGELTSKSASLPEPQPSSFAMKGSDQKHSHKSYVRSSAISNTGGVSAAPTYSEMPTSGTRNGKDHVTVSKQSRVSVISLMLQGNAEQNESLRLDHFADNVSSASSSSTLPKSVHPNHHVGQHHTSYIPTLGVQHPPKQQALINRPDHHHSVQPNTNTSPHHYSFDFLRDVGLKMSLGANNASSGELSMYRGSSQANYNFTQQFQQHMMQHHQNNQLQQQNHASRQTTHQPQQLLQLHQIMPQQPQYNRSPNVYGSGDEMAAQHCAIHDPQAFANYALLNAATEGQNQTANGGKGYDLSSCLFNQNGGAVPSQHQVTHYKQLLEQPQQHNVQMHNYHQNNNYQYHNRNAVSYASQGSGRVIGTVVGREDGGRNGTNGKKFWNTHGKGKNNSNPANGGSKHQFNKVQSIGYGYRKNYQHYYNHPANGGNHYYEHIPIQQQQQPQQQQQHHHHQQQQSHHHHKHWHRNLVYVRGYDRGHGAVSSHEYTNGNQHQEVEQTSVNPHSASTNSPEGNNLEEDINNSNEIQENGVNEPTTCQEPLINGASREEEKDTEKSNSSELHEERVYGSRKLCNVPRSSSSSSVVSIPSTESSVISCNTSHLESTVANGGHDYESDSSHSSDYREGTFRYSKYSDTNDNKAFRSSSSTSSGTSSSSAYLALSEFVPSAPASLHASTAGLVGEFIVRSQSFHGSHQNLMAYANGGNVGDGNPPVGSPKGCPRTVTGTQSVPVFGELFGNHSQTNSIQFVNSQSTAKFGSSSSLELALQTAAISSSSSSSLSASSVPPNDFQSMQSGHPKTRSQSGRTSPTNTIVPYRSHRSTVGGSSVSFPTNTKAQLSNKNGTGRKNLQAAVSYAHRSSVPGDYQPTPADRFILRANEVEMKIPPDALTNGSIWDNLSRGIWERFVGAQQTEEKYVQKMELWRDLYSSIKKGFPKYSLYLVGSTISGFGADSSDVDMCLVSRSSPSCYDHRLEALFSLSLVKEYFMNMPSSSFSEFSLIQAKVPILRFQDGKNGIEVDLNFNNCVGIRNTHLLHCYSQMDWRVRPLVLMVKLWAQHHNINDAKNMTISSYSLVLMVIHFLQCGASPPILPCLHAMYPEKFMKIVDIHNIEMIERIEPYQTDNKESLGELMLNFLEYYTKFDYEHYAISVRTSSIIPVEECRLARSYKNDPHHWKHLCIEEPFDYTNTARSVFDGEVFEQIKSTFATSWQMLKDSKHVNALFGEPLFTPVTSTLSITS
uniref:Uncharacterized protein n=1 Tax=Anopheles minimus TaxID=112268 RepID=A0A182VW86_9DIPT